MSRYPRIMIAATGSGSGKTMLTCGLLQALKKYGTVTSFKCGPDYIDPMFHRQVIGIPSRNLDPYFTDRDTLRYLFARQAEKAEIFVIEGVMGYYDGIGGISSEASSYDLASKLDCPVILVLPCKGMSASIGAMAKGFTSFKSPSGIAGILLNQAPASLYPQLKQMVEQECGVPVVGYVPTLKDVHLESRHLGLVTPDSVENLQEQVEKLAAQLEQTVDLEKIIEIARMAPDMEAAERIKNHIILEKFRRNLSPQEQNSYCKKRQKFETQKSEKNVAYTEKYQEDVSDRKIRIAVAKDEAFCFLYQDNLELLEDMGCELCYFSPLRDKQLPEHISGLYLPGGYPEIYAEQLSENVLMRKALHEAIQSGLPTIAECGGFLYLHEELEDTNGAFYPMIGVARGSAYRTSRLQRFGYIELEAQEEQLLFKKGDKIRSHEFHYWDVPEPGTSCVAVKASGTKSWTCVNGTATMYAGFPHLYFYANPEVAVNFVETCQRFMDF